MRSVELSEDAYEMLCGLVQPTWIVEPECVTGFAWDELRRKFPLSDYHGETGWEADDE